MIFHLFGELCECQMDFFEMKSLANVDMPLHFKAFQSYGRIFARNNHSDQTFPTL